MPLRMMHGGRPLKRWRYVGLFGEQLMACAALVQVGPARQSFWALYERGAGHQLLAEQAHIPPALQRPPAADHAQGHRRAVARRRHRCRGGRYA